MSKSLFEKRAGDVIWEGDDKGLCLSCGKKREEGKIMLCQACADSIAEKAFGDMPAGEILRRLAPAVRRVDRDIKETMIDTN